MAIFETKWLIVGLLMVLLLFLCGHGIFPVFFRKWLKNLTFTSSVHTRAYSYINIYMHVRAQTHTQIYIYLYRPIYLCIKLYHSFQHTLLLPIS